jgi:hypothetical protein
MAASISPPLAPPAMMAAQPSRQGRRRERLRVSLPTHIRPFDSRFAEIEDVGRVVNFNRDGLYFTTGMSHYFVGLRLIVTFPFGKAAAHRKFLASVVRIEGGQGGCRGVAVRLLL